jgi:hypothetical protein
MSCYRTELFTSVFSVIDALFPEEKGRWTVGDLGQSGPVGGRRPLGQMVCGPEKDEKSIRISFPILREFR